MLAPSARFAPPPSSLTEISVGPSLKDDPRKVACDAVDKDMVANVEEAAFRFSSDPVNFSTSPATMADTKNACA